MDIGILDWLPYWQVIFDKRTNLRLRLATVRNVPSTFVFALEELLININLQNIDLSESEVKEIKRHKAVLRKLADPKIASGTKRRIINSGRGFKLLAKLLPDILIKLKSRPGVDQERDCILT